MGLREVALIFPAGDEFWADGQELDLADLYLLATYGRYVEGFNWPQVFAKAMRADGFVPYDPDDPTTNETVLEFGDVEDGACHGNDGKHLTTVDYQSTLIVNLLEGYEDCEGRHKRKVLETEKYFLELQGEGIWELKKLN
ncbi:hypothetical protein [Rhizobium sp. F40D2]|uniref:hypothetical protein n=1 Tax=Rhizobium sp. F40D2 TaxID=3453141 RepID=UPI003F24D26A